MMLNNSNKKLFLLIVSICFIGSIGCYLLYIYKLWPFSNKKIEIPDEKLLNDFVEKGTNIYVERSDKFKNKQDVELRIFSIIVFLKALTSNVSKELFSYLNDLKIKDLYGFKNFIIYLKSKLILEEDKEKIFGILHYFLNEEFNNKKYSNLGYMKSNYYTSDKINLNPQTTADQTYSENMKISQSFANRILELNFENNYEMLKKVNKKEKNSYSILEKIFFMFLMRGYYDPDINVDLAKLIPEFKTHAGNPFFADKEFLEFYENENIYNKQRVRRSLSDGNNVQENESTSTLKNDNTENVNLLIDNDIRLQSLQESEQSKKVEDSIKLQPKRNDPKESVLTGIEEKKLLNTETENILPLNIGGKSLFLDEKTKEDDNMRRLSSGSESNGSNSSYANLSAEEILLSEKN